MMNIITSAIIFLSVNSFALSKIEKTTDQNPTNGEDGFDNYIIDFDDVYSVKFDRKYGEISGSFAGEFNKETHKYIIDNEDFNNKRNNSNKLLDNQFTHIRAKENERRMKNNVKDNNLISKLSDSVESTTVNDYSVIPLELTSTTEISTSFEPITNSYDLSVIPLSTTRKEFNINIIQPVTIPTSTQVSEDYVIPLEIGVTTEYEQLLDKSVKMDSNENMSKAVSSLNISSVNPNMNVYPSLHNNSFIESSNFILNMSKIPTTISLNRSHKENLKNNTDQVDSLNINSSLNSNSNLEANKNTTLENKIGSATYENKNKDNNTVIVRKAEMLSNVNVVPTTFASNLDKNKNNTNISGTDETDDPERNLKMNDTNTKKYEQNSTIGIGSLEDKDKLNVDEGTIPLYTELDVEEVAEIPDDYYDSKDVIPTRPPATDALSVLFGFAGSIVEGVVESVAERVVPKGIYDLIKRMQRQNQALEAEKLRSREENGGLGQFGRGILKTISSGLTRPLSQLMAGVRDIGSLDSDRGFVGSLASGVSSVANYANSLLDQFKDRVQAIYPGTVWCGDGHSAQARSGDLGLFFFTDTCCRQHDACKIFIKAGETKYGLTNTGLFTRSHCSCDTKFRECLKKTNSLVSAQIGLTYFNVLGPQCFRRAHPIVKCIRRTRLTGQKCEEYELDYTKPKMWQWFDSETF